MTEESEFQCDTCGDTVPSDAAEVCGTMGDLDPDAWQTLCCPNCGSRLKTAFLGSGES